VAFALLLAAARRVIEGDRQVREGRFSTWAPFLFLGTEVTGKTLGIVGMGAIGTAVARRARAFRMKILYHNRRRVAPAMEADLEAVFASLADLLQESDFISLHVPLTAETRHLIGPEELCLMKPSAFLINTARGAVVDEQALLSVLREGRIAGAGLDVYENEPTLTPGLTDLANVVLLPHVGSATRETRTRMAALAMTNLLDGLAGRMPGNIVNPEVWPQRR
jgi:glyoxylate reductase